MTCERFAETPACSPQTAHAHTSARFKVASDTPKVLASSEAAAAAADSEKSD